MHDFTQLKKKFSKTESKLIEKADIQHIMEQL